MEILKKIHGETLMLNASEAIHLLESGISEGILTPPDWSSTATEHIFGRKPQVSTSQDLSFLTGIAANGLRAGGLLQWEQLLESYPKIQEMARQHLPVVVFAGGKTANGHAGFYALSGTGCFQMMAATVQQAVDFVLIAHRVAELSLIPGMVALDSAASQNVQFPEAGQVVQFLGAPDEHIPSPTPSQRIIFGETRRRLPNFYSFDFATLLGAEKDPHAKELEAAGQQPYFYQHLDGIFRQVFEEFEALTGRHYSGLLAQKADDANYLLLTTGGAGPQAAEAAQAVRKNSKIKAGCVQLAQVSPFPSTELAKLMQGKKVVTVLENPGGNVAGDSPFFTKVRAAASLIEKKPPSLFKGFCGHEITADEAVRIFENMAAGNPAKEVFYTGIDFTRTATSYPQHEILLQTIQREYPGIDKTTIAAPASEEHLKGTKKAQQARLPLVVRKHKNKGPAYTRLSRFYHDTAHFYQNDEPRELVASPYQALAAMPAATASLSAAAATRPAMPVYEPAACTGCGACFVQCPHAAIPPIATGIESLLRGGMDIAANRGLSTAQLTPLVKNLAKVAGQVIRKAEQPVTAVADFLPAAFEKLARQMKLDGEKLEKAQQDFDNLLNQIVAFPVAITDQFFNHPETLEKGSGELFSLAIDTNACTGCGICAEVCEDEALTMQTLTPELNAATQATFDLWEQLPGTSSGTIRRLQLDEDYDSFAAILLSRHFYLSMTGGSQSEEGAPAKMMLHLLTALTESLVQPGLAGWSSELEELSNTLSEKIHEKLGEALPGEDSHALWKAIAEAGGRRLPLDEIVGKLSRGEHLKLVDTKTLQRKIDLVNDLKELRWILTEGPNGMGRSRLGLAMHSGGLPWAGAWPFNSFMAPVFLNAKGMTVDLAFGLFQGYLRHILDNIRLIRRAQMEAKDQYTPEVHAPKIASLRWEDLTKEEKQLVPPLLLVGDKKALGQNATASLMQILATDWPVKIVLLDTAAYPADEHPARHLAESNVLLLQALAWRKAYIFKGSAGDSKTLFAGLLKGMRRSGPALFDLLAPANEKHLTENWTTLPSLALYTRTFPAFRHEPEEDGGFLSSSISLEGNPSPTENWHRQTLRYESEGEEQILNYSATLANWLFTLKDWQAEFRPALPDEKTTPVANFLKLETSARSGILPVVFGLNEARDLREMVASPIVVAATEAALSQWNTLREIAGTLTRYPEKLWKEAEAELKKKYDEKVAALKAEHEEQMARQEADLMGNVKVKLREKLLMLSRRN
jgi:pyruvate/2-oxoacid:ferredoxin oxidoreductase alpha subunit/ferredoxin